MRACAAAPTRTTGGKRRRRRRRRRGRGKNVAFDYQHFPGVAFSCPQQILTHMLFLLVLCTQALWCAVACTSAAVHASIVVYTGAVLHMVAAVYTCTLAL
eukprot:8770445-Pyramimonas_sp.AAC.1